MIDFRLVNDRVGFSLEGRRILYARFEIDNQLCDGWRRKDRNEAHAHDLDNFASKLHNFYCVDVVQDKMKNPIAKHDDTQRNDNFLSELTDYDAIPHLLHQHNIPRCIRQ